MFELVEISGRTGQEPVRPFLVAALGQPASSDLQQYEIRYRNDQYRALYGIYESSKLQALVGLERDRDGDRVLHLAITGAPGEDPDTRAATIVRWLGSRLGIMDLTLPAWSTVERVTAPDGQPVPFWRLRYAETNP